MPHYGPSDFLDLGENNVICDACGKKYKASELRRRWDGFMVCWREWEPRQPQDFVRGTKDIQTPIVSRPPPGLEFILSCSLQGRSGVAGFGVAGCSLPSYVPQGLVYVP